jgi:hypothetical protein
VIQDHDKPLDVLLRYEHFTATQEKIQGGYSLLVFCGFAHHPQRVLVIVFGKALMSDEGASNLRPSEPWMGNIRLELDAAMAACADRWRWRFLKKVELSSLRHDSSLPLSQRL